MSDNEGRGPTDGNDFLNAILNVCPLQDGMVATSAIVVIPYLDKTGEQASTTQRSSEC